MEHSIGGCTLDEIYDAVNAAVSDYLTHRQNTDPTRKGGYCTVLHCLSGRVITTFQVGKPATARADEQRESSQKKALKLLLANLEKGHLSSGQSCRETENKWGAIVAGAFILSFSGFSPDLVDEAVMLRVAIKLGWMEESEARAIAHISSNDWFVRLIAA